MLVVVGTLVVGVVVVVVLVVVGVVVVVVVVAVMVAVMLMVVEVVVVVVDPTDPFLLHWYISRAFKISPSERSCRCPTSTLALLGIVSNQFLGE